MSGEARGTWQAGAPALRSALDEALAEGALEATPLHEGPHRTLVAVDLEARGFGRVVVKRHHRPEGAGSTRALRDRLLGRTPARREWHALEALHAAGLPVPEPLARGTLPDGDGLVVMRHVGDADLATALRSADANRREGLVRRLAETVTALHAAGFVHGDLHLGNLRTRGDDVVLLDPGRGRRTTSARARRADAARLLYAMERTLDDPALVETLREALSGDAALDAARRIFLRDHRRGRSRRSLRTGRGWRRLDFEHPGRVGLAGADVDARVIEAALLDAEPVHRAAPRRDGRVTIEALEIEGRRWIRKRVRAGSLRRALADRLRGSSAARAFRRGQRDRLISDRSARALAWVEERTAIGVAESTLILERVGDLDLDAFYPQSDAEARDVAIALARWLAEQHAVGLSHRDAKGGNVRLSVASGRARFWWVDLEDLVGPRRLDEAARLRALVQLNASLADEAFDPATRWTALAAYAARLPFRAPLREVAREIHVRSLARDHRYQGGEGSEPAGKLPAERVATSRPSP